MESYMDEFLKISQGLLTPVIAAIALYIAYQQWKTNDNKLKWDKYEKGIEIYKEIVNFISIGINETNYKNDELMSFKPKVSEADFLFGEEIPKYIDELQKRAVKLSYWNKKYRDYTQPKLENYDHEKIEEEMHKELVWISSQLEPARNLFKKYLDVSR